MSAFCAPLARPLVQVIGGLQRSTSDRLFLCRLIGGLLTPGMRLPRKGSAFWHKGIGLMPVRILGFALSPVPRGWIRKRVSRV